MLQAKAVLHGVGILELRVYRAQTKNCRGSCRASGNVRQIGVVEGHRSQKRHHPRLREDDVALGLVVENAKAAANDRLVIIEGRKGKTEARREVVLSAIEAARSSRRHSQDKGAISARHANQLVCRHAVARAHQAVNDKSLVKKGTAGHIESTATQGGGRDRVIQIWLEISHVVALRVGRPYVLIANA